MRRQWQAIVTAALATVLTLTACGSEPSTEGAVQPHNDADVTFAQHMIPHHQQAVRMSDIILAKQQIDPRVTALAEAIKAAQDPEIHRMRSWLSQWGAPTTMSMPGHGMAGMMSEHDLSALNNAQGAEAAKLFLRQMIAHHQGAIDMAQDEIRSGQYPPAKTMAQSIATSQQQEITEMQGILASL